MGGYAVADGRRVRWRRLLRSGHMAASTDRPPLSLAELGVVAVCDLRTTGERQRRPSVWGAEPGVHYYCRDYEMSAGNLERFLQSVRFSAEEARKAMHATYAELPYEQAPAYRRIFELLVAGSVPLIFNCSAGKDRTGVAAALVLSALGVPRDVIEQDYALSDQAIDGLVADMNSSSAHYPHLQALPLESCMPLMSADPAYLETAFQVIDRQSGGIHAYLRDVLNLAESDIAELHNLLLG